MRVNFLKSAILALAVMLTPTFALAADYFIDVRSPQEYETDHIEGHLNIVHTEIVAGVKANNITPNDKIYVYCRSGKRASIAKTELNNAGYPNVTNLGGIEDARNYLK